MSARKSPFLINLRRHPNIYGEGKELTQKVQKVNEFIQKIKKTGEMMKQRIDKSKRKTIKYKEENLI